MLCVRSFKQHFMLLKDIVAGLKKIVNVCHFTNTFMSNYLNVCIDLEAVGGGMDVISGMATMAMAIPTISFGHRSGHFWP